jgi:hypothetical protein
MSGRGKGGKGLGAYHAHIDPKVAKTMFLRVLPKKYHTAFLAADLDDWQVERWLHTILEGQDWEKATIREELTQQLRSEKPIRFVKVVALTPAYNQQKKDYETKKTTRARKKKALAELVQTPHVKYAVGSPAYMERKEHYQNLAMKLNPPKKPKQ